MNPFFQHRTGDVHYPIHGHPEVLSQLSRCTRFAKGVDPDHPTIQPGVVAQLLTKTV
jgi:hypothetical protein